MDGEDLYSVKWYKDGHEFYRYLPSNFPPALVFRMPGISVDVSRRKASAILIENAKYFYSFSLSSLIKLPKMSVE